MNSAKYFNFRIHKCRESLFYTRVLAAWHKMYTQLQTSGFLLTRGWWRFSKHVGVALAV